MNADPAPIYPESDAPLSTPLPPAGAPLDARPADEFLLNPETAAFIGALPKAELHIHLEGSIRPGTLLDLAQRHNRMDLLPGDDLDTLQRWFVFTDFPHFVRVYMAISHLLLDAEDFATIVYACGEEMALQNIRYREVTFTPFTHTHTLGKPLAIGEILDGLEEGRRRAAADFGVEMRWVFDVPRNAAFGADGRYDPLPAEETLRYALRGRDRGVIGFGLGGYEVTAPPRPFAHAFRAAKEAGLLALPHAGETLGPESVWSALEDLGADRIGHGVRAIEDPALLLALKERQVPLEVNPTSNVRLHVYRRLAEHPFSHLDRMGLLLTIGSDDPPLFNTTLTREYEALALEFGYDRADIARIARNGFACSAAPDDLKRALLDEFDAFLAANL
jgi:aminodeoxyfutalosine deaminase